MKPAVDRLPKYWRDNEGRLAILHRCQHGKAHFSLVIRRTRIVVSTFELYRTWHPDLGSPIPKNAMPSICNRASP